MIIYPVLTAYYFIDNVCYINIYIYVYIYSLPFISLIVLLGVINNVEQV